MKYGKYKYIAGALYYVRRVVIAGEVTIYYWAYNPVLDCYESINGYQYWYAVLVEIYSKAVSNTVS